MGAGKGAFYYNEKDTSHDPGLHAGGSSVPDRLQSKRFRFLRQHEHEHGRQFIADGAGAFGVFLYGFLNRVLAGSVRLTQVELSPFMPA